MGVQNPKKLLKKRRRYPPTKGKNYWRNSGGTLRQKDTKRRKREKREKERIKRTKEKREKEKK